MGVAPISSVFSVIWSVARPWVIGGASVVVVIVVANLLR